ncbi:MAG: hypothetical protein HC898_09075 [Phycisphaerales bacterium]|nr:hypothetical protein [Phycisphaerales bacterium]
MKRIHAYLLVILGLSFFGMSAAYGQEIAPVQEPATPSAAPIVANAVLTAAPLSVQPADNPTKAVIGSNDPALGYKAQYHLSPYGAGIWWTTLTDYQYRPLAQEPYAILKDQLPNGDKTHIYHLAARSITVNGYRYELATVAWELVQGDTKSMNQAVYRVTLVDAENQPVLEITRTFTLDQNSYDLRCVHTLANRSGQPLVVRFEQNGPSDIAADESGYMGDRREFIAGYFNLTYDPGRTRIYTDNTLAMRSKVLEQGRYWPTKNLPAQYELVWLANVNRYFAVAVHPIVPADHAQASTIPPLHTLYPQESVGAQITGLWIDKTHDHRTVTLTLASRDIEIPAGNSVDLGISLFAGPRSPSLLPSRLTRLWAWMNWSFTTLVVCAPSAPFNGWRTFYSGSSTSFTMCCVTGRWRSSYW